MTEIPSTVETFVSSSVSNAVVIDVNGETEYLEVEQAHALADALRMNARQAAGD